MRKLTVTLFISLIAVMGLQAASSDLFSLNEEAVSDQLQQLTEIDEIVENNEGITLEDLQVNSNDLLQGVTLDVNNLMSPQFGFDDIEWGSFFWGFCCWPVGVFTVLLNDNKDSDDRISYYIGIGTATVVYIISYFTFYAWIFSSSI